jgi:hypothetical protein
MYRYQLSNLHMKFVYRPNSCARIELILICCCVGYMNHHLKLESLFEIGIIDLKIARRHGRSIQGHENSKRVDYTTHQAVRCSVTCPLTLLVNRCSPFDSGSCTKLDAADACEIITGCSSKC